MNPSIAPRYFHVIVASLIIGAFTSLALGGWYLLKNKHIDFAMKTVRIGAVVGIVASCAMIVTAHASAVQVSEEQPTKLAMMEGMYNDEVPPLYAFGCGRGKTRAITPFAIPGGTSFLATGTWDTEYNAPAFACAGGEVLRHERRRSAREPCVPNISPDGCHVWAHHGDGDPCDCLHHARRARPLDALAAEAVRHLAAVPVRGHSSWLGHGGGGPSAVGRLSFDDWSRTAWLF